MDTSREIWTVTVHFHDLANRHEAWHHVLDVVAASEEGAKQAVFDEYEAEGVEEVFATRKAS